MALTHIDVAAAIEALPDEGGVVHLEPTVYDFEDTVAVPRNVHLRMTSATRIDHSGNGAAFMCRDAGPFDVTARRSISGLRLQGNDDPAAIGVDIGDQWGFRLHDTLIQGYKAGRGLRQLNERYWSEGTDLDGVMIRDCATHIEFARTNGTDSFGYQRWRNVNFAIGEEQTGIDFGGDSTSGIYVYNSDFDVAVWLEGMNATAVKVRPVANVDGNRYRIVGECPGSFTGRLGIENIGGALRGYGVVNITGAPDLLTGGITEVVGVRPDGSFALPGGGRLRSGPGSPQNVVAAPPGTIYLRMAGTPKLWVKESGGGGASGWAVK